METAEESADLPFNVLVGIRLIDQPSGAPPLPLGRRSVPGCLRKSWADLGSFFAVQLGVSTSRSYNFVPTAETGIPPQGQDLRDLRRRVSQGNAGPGAAGRAGDVVGTTIHRDAEPPLPRRVEEEQVLSAGGWGCLCPTTSDPPCWARYPGPHASSKPSCLSRRGCPRLPARRAC